MNTINKDKETIKNLLFQIEEQAKERETTDTAFIRHFLATPNENIEESVRKEQLYTRYRKMDDSVRALFYKLISFNQKDKMETARINIIKEESILENQATNSQLTETNKALLVTNVDEADYENVKLPSKAKKVLKGVATAALVLAILGGGHHLSKAMFDKQPVTTDTTQTQEVEEEIEEKEEVEETEEIKEETPSIARTPMTDPNNNEEVSARAEEIMEDYKALGLDIQVPDIATGQNKPLDQADIEGLIYWANYAYLEQENIDKASNMDKAAQTLAVICSTYEMYGETSQRIAGISGLPADQNAGKYNVNLAKLFCDNTIQQSELDEITTLTNGIKNNPTVEGAKSYADKLMDLGVRTYIMDESDMNLTYMPYSQANFVRGMMLTVNQSAVNLGATTTIDGVAYSDYTKLTDMLNEVDGPLNFLGRDIDKSMACEEELGYK